jgi:hypothetical protein
VMSSGSPGPAPTNETNVRTLTGLAPFARRVGKNRRESVVVQAGCHARVR